VDTNSIALPLDSTVLARISAIQEDFASRGQRVLLLAKKIVSQVDLYDDKEAIADPTQLEDKLLTIILDLTIVGLIALVDPPRGDTPETVRICRRAGIRFAMVTGR
jgi:sodium/potassium-transporting ATPase subunit alpha